MKTRTPQHVRDILNELRPLLAEASATSGIELEVQEDGYVEEDDWINVIVTPNTPNVRAYDYVDLLSQVEKQLRERMGREKIVLVPAVPG